MAKRQIVYVLERIVDPKSERWEPIASCIARKPLGVHKRTLLDSGFVRSELRVVEYYPPLHPGKVSR